MQKAKLRSPRASSKSVETTSVLSVASLLPPALLVVLCYTVACTASDSFEGGIPIPSSSCVPEVECDEGYYSCKDRACVCNSTWDGVNCSMCTGGSNCGKGNECSTNMWTYSRKFFACNSTDVTVQEFLKNGQINWDCSIDPSSKSDDGVCNVQVWKKPSGPPLVFACELGGCGEKQNGKTLVYSCDTAKCWCGPNYDCEGVLQTLLDGMHGSSTLSCKSGGDCSFEQSQFPVTIPLQCTAGECVPKKFKPKFELTPIQVLACIMSVVVFIVAAVLYAIMYRASIASAMWRGVAVAVAAGEADTGEDEVGEPCTLSFHGVSYGIDSGLGETTYLEAMSGLCRAGEVTAIMGPSGAGKTTLLNILADRVSEGTVRGEVRVNGCAVDGSFRRVVGFVSQDDILMPTLTVRESIMYSAELRLPPSISTEQKMARVLKIADELGLSHVIDTRVGSTTNRGVSGGERKRVSIACEMVTAPRILFLDEPTSGLDSATALNIMKTLMGLARAGTTVIFSIHQPRSNIYNMFDTLILLAKGKLIFNGPADGATTHFAALGHSCPRNYNPADYLLDLVALSDRGVVEQLARDFEGSPSHRAIVSTLMGYNNRPGGDGGSRESGATRDRRLVSFSVETDTLRGSSSDDDVLIPLGPPGGSINSGARSAAATALGGALTGGAYSTSFFHQLSILCHRMGLQVVRDPSLLIGHNLVAITVGLILGRIYYHVTDNIDGFQDRMGVLFFLCAILSFTSLSSIDTFVTGRALLLHETANGCYRTISYYVAKVIVDFFPLRILPPIVMGSIAYWLVGLQAEPLSHFYIFSLVLVLVNVVAASFCFVAAILSPNTGVGNLVMVLIILFFMLFGGFFLNRDSVPKDCKWLFKWSYFNYAFEALMVNELSGLSIDFDPKGYSSVLNVQVNGNVLLANLSMNPDSLWPDIRKLGIQAAIYLLVAYVFLELYVLGYVKWALHLCRYAFNYSLYGWRMQK